MPRESAIQHPRVARERQTLEVQPSTTLACYLLPLGANTDYLALLQLDIQLEKDDIPGLDATTWLFV
jgi:hypothetical protein